MRITLDIEGTKYDIDVPENTPQSAVDENKWIMQTALVSSRIENVFPTPDSIHRSLQGLFASAPTS